MIAAAVCFRCSRSKARRSTRVSPRRSSAPDSKRSKAYRHALAQPSRPSSAWKSGKPSGQCATASPSRTILANGRAMTGGSDGDELDRPIPPVPRPQANVVAVFVNDNPEAVVLQLVQPAVARWHLLGEDGLTR